MKAQTFIRIWSGWAFAVLLFVTGYGLYRGYHGLEYSTFRMLAVGFGGMLVVNVPFFLWRNRIR